MRIVAIKVCPQGQRPGTVFEVPDVAATVLIAAGAARAATVEKIGGVSTLTAKDQAKVNAALDEPVPATRRNRRPYQRRDLQAEV